MLIVVKRLLKKVYVVLNVFINLEPERIILITRMVLLNIKKDMFISDVKVILKQLEMGNMS